MLRAGLLYLSAAGEDVLAFSPSKQYQSIVLSSPDLAEGASYDLYLGGSSTGTATGTLYTSFTLSDLVTWISSNSRR